MSHHHFDHSTGLRAAIAEGLTVVTQAGNEAFVKEMAARPFTRTPDTLAKAPKPPVVVAVGDTHTITDGARELLLYHVAGNPHSDTMLMAYLPRERLLIEVDAFSPGGTYHPYAANLLEHVQKREAARRPRRPAARDDPAVQRARRRGQAGVVGLVRQPDGAISAVSRAPGPETRAPPDCQRASPTNSTAQ